MDGNASSPGDKPHNLIPRHRRTAAGKTDCHVINALHHNAALRTGRFPAFPAPAGSSIFHAVACHLLQDICIRQDMLAVLPAVFLHLIDNLAFLQASMANRCQHRIPVTEAILAHNAALVRSLVQFRPVDALRFAILRQQILAPGNVLFLKFTAEPLVNLILGLGALDNIQPVPARAPGILGSQYFNPVPILDDIINIH